MERKELHHIIYTLERLDAMRDLESKEAKELQDSIAYRMQKHMPTTRDRLQEAERKVEEYENFLLDLASLPKTRLGKEGFTLLQQFIDSKYPSDPSDNYK